MKTCQPGRRQAAAPRKKAQRTTAIGKGDMAAAREMAKAKRNGGK